MRKIFIILFVSSIWASNLFADTTIFYANGMFNTQENANVSKEALREKLKPHLPPDISIKFELAYNQQEFENLTKIKMIDTTATVLVQLFEVYMQKKSDIYTFWDWVGGVVTPPNWFQKEIRKIVLQSLSDLSYIDGDLIKHLGQYEDALQDGQIIIVSHSQGNFYANEAHDLLNSNDVDVLAVATPCREVAGGGKWVTLTDDKIINLVRDGVDIYTLPGNTTNNSSGEDWMGHNFIEKYLKGDESGPRIVGSVIDLIKNDTLDEDFERYQLGEWLIGWKGTGLFGSVELDPVDSSNQVLMISEHSFAFKRMKFMNEFYLEFDVYYPGVLNNVFSLGLGLITDAFPVNDIISFGGFRNDRFLISRDESFNCNDIGWYNFKIKFREAGPTELHYWVNDIYCGSRIFDSNFSVENMNYLFFVSNYTMAYIDNIKIYE